MSQQGPGGYGGYPPGGGPPGGYGGFPPGPGQPPGGYGPPGSPPGGYGGPGAPGGHGGPGGPGWGQQPQHGGPSPYGAPPPPGPPPKKGTSPVVWLGVGCGVLLLVGGAGAAWFFYTASQKISAALAVGSAIAFVDGGVAVTVPPTGAGGAGGTVILPGPAGLATGGPSCELAAKCCRSMVAKSGGNPAAEAACDNMKTLPQVGCEQALETYKRSAPLIGASCP
jgi:hypothetical protein